MSDKLAIVGKTVIEGETVIVGKTPTYGYTVFKVRDKDVGGLYYMSDSIGGGAIIVPCWVSLEELTLVVNDIQQDVEAGLRKEIKALREVVAAYEQAKLLRKEKKEENNGS